MILAVDFMKLSKYSTIDVEYWLKIMDKNKRSRIENFICEEDKKRSILGDVLLRKTLSKYLKVFPDKLDIVTNPVGKPVLNNENIFLSISHSNDMVACAVADCEVGIDVELIRNVDTRLVDLFCTEREKEYILQSKINMNVRFFEIWTFKEAYYKATGKIDNKNICCFDWDDIRTFYVKDGYAVTIVNTVNKKEGDYDI